VLTHSLTHSLTLVLAHSLAHSLTLVRLLAYRLLECIFWTNR